MAQAVEADGVLEEVLFEHVMYQDVGGQWRAVASYKGTPEQIDKEFALAWISKIKRFDHGTDNGAGTGG